MMEVDATSVTGRNMSHLKERVLESMGSSCPQLFRRERRGTWDGLGGSLIDSEASGTDSSHALQNSDSN